ncbi:hypothetical protein CC79DRAFT_1345558 [Sarocladium strictum]
MDGVYLIDNDSSPGIVSTVAGLSRFLDDLEGLLIHPPSLYIDLEGENLGCTLRDILESLDIPKVFFDVRNNSDALYSHYTVRLAGVQDLQLMELATRTFGRKCVNRLARCIERDASLSFRESQRWKRCKEKGVLLFAPERGGELSNVHFLPRLWKLYDSKLEQAWRARVSKATSERVVESQSSRYVPHGQHKALAPKGWISLR